MKLEFGMDLERWVGRKIGRDQRRAFENDGVAWSKVWWQEVCAQG